MPTHSVGVILSHTFVALVGIFGSVLGAFSCVLNVDQPDAAPSEYGPAQDTKGRRPHTDDTAGHPLGLTRRILSFGADTWGAASRAVAMGGRISPTPIRGHQNANHELGLNGGFSLPPPVQNVECPRSQLVLTSTQVHAPPVDDAFIDDLNIGSTSWYLRGGFEEGKDIIIGPDGKLRGATVLVLAERLLTHRHADEVFTERFLTTFKCFTGVDHLVQLLIERFWTALPERLSEVERERETLKRHTTRMRILSIFETMVSDDDILEAKDLYVLDRLVDFLQHDEVHSIETGRKLLVLIERIRNGDSACGKRMIVYDPQPTPIVPSAKAIPNLLDLNRLEVARQLTMIECGIFMKIKGCEYLSTTSEPKIMAHSIRVAIETSNKIACWVADAVLEKKSVRMRALVVEYLIVVADRCRDLRNFSSMIAIVSGLNSPPVRRLKRTWDRISQKLTRILSTCVTLIDSGRCFRNYCHLLRRTAPPCVPFIGINLTALILAQDDVTNVLPNNLIDFNQWAKIAGEIQEIRKWKSKPFNFGHVEPIADYLHDQFAKFNDVTSANATFLRLSLEHEPDKYEDESLAKRL